MKSSIKAAGVGFVLALLIGTAHGPCAEESTTTVKSSTFTLALPTVAAPASLGYFWNPFLAALRSGNDAAVRSQCTAGGYKSFISRMDPQKPHDVDWRRLGAAFTKWGPVRWKSITSITAYGVLGPAIQEHSFTLVLTPKGWKLDEWNPGDSF